jgi:transposase
LFRDRARVIDDGSAKRTNAGFLKRRRKAARVSQRWRAAMASTAVFYVDGSRSWQQCQRQRSSRCRSPMRAHRPMQGPPLGGRVMTLLPPGVKVHLALGYIDMRKGIDGLAMLVQSVLRQDPFSGHLFVFRGRTRANLIKIIFWDGTGLCLFTEWLCRAADRVDPPRVPGPYHRFW